jgi:hypothetical protein
MKRTAIFFAALLAGSSLVAATRPKILIQANFDKGFGYKDPDSVAAYLVSYVEPLISKEFPCASTVKLSDVYALVGFMRTRALVGVPADQEAEYEEQCKALGGAMEVDYIVLLQAKALPNRWFLDAKWLDVRKREAIAMESEETPPSEAALLDASERVVNKLIDAAAYYEICPYTGPVKIKIHSTKSKRGRVEYPVSCNGLDQQYVKTTSLDRTEDINLDLQRTGRIWATGNVQYESVETDDFEEQDPCHLCPSGKKGVRIETKHTRTEIKVAGFSQDSSIKDRQFTDVRLYLKFYKNGTYTLELKGATKPGTKRVRIDHKAEGVCDTKIEPKPEPDTTTAFDAPLGQIIGPLEGTPKDKSLTAHKEIRSRDPATGEDTTINVEFQLHRD